MRLGAVTNVQVATEYGSKLFLDLREVESIQGSGSYNADLDDYRLTTVTMKSGNSHKIALSYNKFLELLLDIW